MATLMLIIWFAVVMVLGGWAFMLTHCVIDHYAQKKRANRYF